MKLTSLTLLLLPVLVAGAIFLAAKSGFSAAVPNNEQPTTNNEMPAAAQAFLAALTPAQKAKTVFPLDSEVRLNWHFTVPWERKGLVFKEMNQEQRRLCLALVQTGLSRGGYAKTLALMEWENVTSDMEGRPRGNDFRNPELYYLALFGDPASGKPWGWRFEGHHLSLNYTSVADQLSVTPHFMGANPGTIPSGERKGERLLAEEEELGRRLVQSLDDSQRRMCVISPKAFPEIVTGVEHVAALPGKAGIPYAALLEDQQELLAVLLKVYFDRMKPEIAEAKWATIQRQGLDNLYFAWAGGLLPGQGHYYRIQGKSFVVEYDNTQNNANHIHTVWREFDGDYGRDLLREHLRINGK